MADLIAGEIPAGWQRWTIDEIDEDLVRVLVAVSHYPLESTAAEAFDERDAAGLRAAVVQDEAASPDDLWSDERAAYVDGKALADFLARRNTAAGLPDARDLREGDVFWVVLPPTVAAEASGLAPTAIVTQADQLEPAVLDVTAASRQAARRTYEAALTAASEDAPEGAPEAAN